MNINRFHQPCLFPKSSSIPVGVSCHSRTTHCLTLRKKRQMCRLDGTTVGCSFTLPQASMSNIYGSCLFPTIYHTASFGTLASPPPPVEDNTLRSLSLSSSPGQCWGQHFEWQQRSLKNTCFFPGTEKFPVEEKSNKFCRISCVFWKECFRFLEIFWLGTDVFSVS